MELFNFSYAFNVNGIQVPTGLFAQLSFDRKWSKAKECYQRLASCYHDRNREWRQISEDLKVAWGYQVPSLVEVEGFVNPRFRTPTEAIKVCNQKLLGLDASDLGDYAGDLIDNFRSWWNAEIQVTAKAKDSTLVILRESKGKTPNLDEIKSFVSSVTAEQEYVIKDDQTPIWVACRPENVKDYLKFFTRNQTYVNFK